MPKPKKRSLSVQFIAPAHEVKVFYDGQLVVHSSLADGHPVLHTMSLRGGPHTLSTLPKLDLTILAGPCSVAIGGGKAKKLKTGAKLKLPPGTQFSLKADSAVAVVLGVPKPGPGLENGWVDVSDLA